MAVGASLYGKALTHFVKGEISYLSDPIKVALLTSAYTFNQDVHETFADVVAAESVGSGYTARGQLLGTKTVTYDAATNRARAFAADSVWTPAAGGSLATAHAVVYKDTGTNSTSWLIGYVNFGTTVTTTGAALTINWDDVEGVFRLEAS